MRPVWDSSGFTVSIYARRAAVLKAAGWTRLHGKGQQTWEHPDHPGFWSLAAAYHFQVSGNQGASMK